MKRLGRWLSTFKRGVNISWSISSMAAPPLCLQQKQELMSNLKGELVGLLLVLLDCTDLHNKIWSALTCNAYFAPLILLT